MVNAPGDEGGTDRFATGAARPQRRMGSQENGQHDTACRSLEDLGCLGAC